MPNHALTGARLGQQTDSPLGGLYLAQAVNELSPYTIPVFATAAARDTAFASWVAAGNTMRDGLKSYLTSPGRTEYYRTGRWWADAYMPTFTTIAQRNSYFGSTPPAGSMALVGGRVHAFDTAWRFRLSLPGAGTTNPEGFFSFAHAGGQTPVAWGVGATAQQSDLLNTILGQLLAATYDATNLTIRATRNDGVDGGFLRANPINFHWWADF